MAHTALHAYKSINYSRYVPLKFAEASMRLQRRVPSPGLMRWANTFKMDIKQAANSPLKNSEVIYAREQFFLRDHPNATLRLQALRIGEVAICATPTEIFGITGIKLKLQSPLPTVVVTLANGAEGYVPPPEQHALGGYSTWPARHAGLEVNAELAIVEGLLGLLEEVSGGVRQLFADPVGLYVMAVLASRPVGFWRLGDIGGVQATNAVDPRKNGVYERGVAFFLPGYQASGMASSRYGNRAAHFAGGGVHLPFPSVNIADCGWRSFLLVGFWLFLVACTVFP